jgi:hypothetical protein
VANAAADMRGVASPDATARPPSNGGAWPAAGLSDAPVAAHWLVWQKPKGLEPNGGAWPVAGLPDAPVAAHWLVWQKPKGLDPGGYGYGPPTPWEMHECMSLETPPPIRVPGMAMPAMPGLSRLSTAGQQ